MKHCSEYLLDRIERRLRECYRIVYVFGNDRRMFSEIRRWARRQRKVSKYRGGCYKNLESYRDWAKPWRALSICKPIKERKECQ